MTSSFTVSLEKIIKEFSLEVLAGPKEHNDIFISKMDVNRPGLHLAGYYGFFDPARFQIFGNTEMGFFDNLDESLKEPRLEKFFSLKPCAVVITRGLEPHPAMIKYANQYNVPLLRTVEPTYAFNTEFGSFLSVELAPRVTRHGVLVEVYGEGILLLGESGVGKSETAIELVKRGHRLIADDAVEIRKVSNKTLVGSSPENIRHFIELRGIGIVNARRLYGIGSVKNTEKINMVIQLEIWDQSKVYDRMGLDNEYTEILGNKVPCMTIPVKPGRNLAVIIEVAAMNNRQKRMGYNAAKELLKRLGMPAESDSQGEDWGV